MKKLIFLGVLCLLTVFLIGCKTDNSAEAGSSEAVDAPAIAQEEAAIGSDSVNTDLEDLDSLDELDQELEDDLLADLEGVELE